MKIQLLTVIKKTKVFCNIRSDKLKVTVIIPAVDKRNPVIVLHESFAANRQDTGKKAEEFAVQILLVFGTDQIVHCFNRVEGADRNFDKQCVPVRHGTIPQTR